MDHCVLTERGIVSTQIVCESHFDDATSISQQFKTEHQIYIIVFWILICGTWMKIGVVARITMFPAVC